MYECLNVYAQKSLSHSLTLTLFQVLIHLLSQLLSSFLCPKVTLSLSLTLTLSHSHTLSISHSITLDMLNKFCFHLYAQKSLFIGQNCNEFFLTSSSSSREFRVSRAGSQLKIQILSTSIQVACQLFFFQIYRNQNSIEHCEDLGCWVVPKHNMWGG